MTYLVELNLIVANSAHTEKGKMKIGDYHNSNDGILTQKPSVHQCVLFHIPPFTDIEVFNSSFSQYGTDGG